MPKNPIHTCTYILAKMLNVYSDLELEATILFLRGRKPLEDRMVAFFSARIHSRFVRVIRLHIC